MKKELLKSELEFYTFTSCGEDGSSWPDSPELARPCNKRSMDWPKSKHAMRLVECSGEVSIINEHMGKGGVPSNTTRGSLRSSAVAWSGWRGGRQ